MYVLYDKSMNQMKKKILLKYLDNKRFEVYHNLSVINHLVHINHQRIRVCLNKEYNYYNNFCQSFLI